MGFTRCFCPSHRQKLCTRARAWTNRCTTVRMPLACSTAHMLHACTTRTRRRRLAQNPSIEPRPERSLAHQAFGADVAGQPRHAPPTCGAPRSLHPPHIRANAQLHSSSFSSSHVAVVTPPCRVAVTQRGFACDVGHIAHCTLYHTPDMIYVTASLHPPSTYPTPLGVASLQTQRTLRGRTCIF